MQANETTVRQEGDVDYQKLRFPYVRSQDQDAAPTARRPVVIVGAGPVGLSLAIDLAQRQVPVVLLESSDCLSVGSRALCFAKRTLEIFDRLGCGDRMVNKGVSWNLGKVSALTCCPSQAMPIPPLSICNSTTWKAIWPNARLSCH